MQSTVAMLVNELNGVEGSIDLSKLGEVARDISTSIAKSIETRIPIRKNAPVFMALSTMLDPRYKLLKWDSEAFFECQWKLLRDAFEKEQTVYEAERQAEKEKCEEQGVKSDSGSRAALRSILSNIDVCSASSETASDYIAAMYARASLRNVYPSQRQGMIMT
jgi:hypothetical protein